MSRSVKLAVVLAVLFGTLLLACSNASPYPGEATHSINTTEEPPRNLKKSVSLPTGKVQKTDTPHPQSENTPTPVSDKETHQSPNESSASESFDFVGINIFDLPFANFPFSCAELEKPEFTSAFSLQTL